METPILLTAAGHPMLPAGYTPAAEHLAIDIPPGWVEVQGYVPHRWIWIAGRERMAIGDVDSKYQRIMGLRHHRPGYTPSPVPKGHWTSDPIDGRLLFKLNDGRHRTVAGLLWQDERILVKWNSPDPAAWIAQLQQLQAPPEFVIPNPN